MCLLQLGFGCRRQCQIISNTAAALRPTRAVYPVNPPHSVCCCSWTSRRTLMARTTSRARSRPGWLPASRASNFYSASTSLDAPRSLKIPSSGSSRRGNLPPCSLVRSRLLSNFDHCFGGVAMPSNTSSSRDNQLPCGRGCSSVCICISGSLCHIRPPVRAIQCCSMPWQMKAQPHFTAVRPLASLGASEPMKSSLRPKCSTPDQA